MGLNYLLQIPGERHERYYHVVLAGTNSPVFLDVAAGRYRIAPWVDDELLNVQPSSCFVAATDADRRNATEATEAYFGAYVFGGAPLVLDIDGVKPRLTFRGVLDHRVSVTRLEKEVQS